MPAFRSPPGRAWLGLALFLTLTGPEAGAGTGTGTGTAPPAAARVPAGVQADFGREQPPPEVRQVAGWSLHTGDNAGRSVVVVDKQQARVWVLGPQGQLRGTAPVLLGLARGDHTVPGIGDRPLSQIRPDERTTPAGRFIAEQGLNASGEDVVWVDYASAVSMHRVRTAVKAERRLQRLATPTPQDNRISYGCINLPRAFYEQVLLPAVRGGRGAVVYVLPETRPAHQLFGSFDPPGRAPAAAAAQAGAV